MYTTERYRQLLTHLKKAGFTAQAFGDKPSERSLLLRHDIDFSLGWAVRMAELNAEQNMMGTFKFQLRSPMYNLRSASALRAVRRVIALGQRVACHVTLPPEDPPTDEEFISYLTQEFAAAQALVPEMEPVLSIHSPSARQELFERFKRLNIPGFLNAYDERHTKEYCYVGDSNLRHSFEELLRRIDDASQLQLLIHPFQWLAEADNMVDILFKTMLQVLTELEACEIGTNHVYKKAYPQGLLRGTDPQEFARFLRDRP